MIKRLTKEVYEEIGAPFVRFSDEFYITAEIDVPNEEFYDEYDQLEDGVGMIRYFRDAIDEDIRIFK